MAILEASTSNVQLRIAECPYPDCDGVRTYYRKPGENTPVPIDDKDIKIDAFRMKYPIGTFDEDISPIIVDVNRTKVLVDQGTENERYQLTDSFTIENAEFTVSELVGSTINVDYELQEKGSPNRHKVRRKVAANTIDTITLDRPLPVYFESTLFGVNILVINQDQIKGQAIQKAKKAWERFLFSCPSCGKMFYVDKP